MVLVRIPLAKMSLLLKSAYLLCSECQNFSSPEQRKLFISLHVGLTPNVLFEPCVCFIQNDNVLKVNDGVFLEIRKYFQKIDNFFCDSENSTFPAIPIDNIVIQPVDSITTDATTLHHKLIQIMENGPTNDPHSIIIFDFKTWLQLVHLRDILCLKLTLLRKYRIYANIIFDRLVNHLATLESSEVDVLQLPTDMIYEHRYLRVNIEHFDIHLCQLLDAEIRAFMADSIRTNAQNLRDTRAITFTSFHPFI